MRALLKKPTFAILTCPKIIPVLVTRGKMLKPYTGTLKITAARKCPSSCKKTPGI